jgi:altronate dehydratase
MVTVRRGTGFTPMMHFFSTGQGNVIRQSGLPVIKKFYCGKSAYEDSTIRLEAY